MKLKIIQKNNEIFYRNLNFCEKAWNILEKFEEIPIKNDILLKKREIFRWNFKLYEKRKFL